MSWSCRRSLLVWALPSFSAAERVKLSCDRNIELSRRRMETSGIPVDKPQLALLNLYYGSVMIGGGDEIPTHDLNLATVIARLILIHTQSSKY